MFYQNGTWEYSALTGDEKGFKMNPDDLTMIPIYCGVEGEEQAGLCTGTENYWSINKNASEADINATIDFLTWVVTSDEGTTMMAEPVRRLPLQELQGAQQPLQRAGQRVCRRRQVSCHLGLQLHPERQRLA